MIQVAQRHYNTLNNVESNYPMVFPTVMYRCERWIIKKSDCWRTDAVELWCLRKFFKSPLDSKEIKPIVKEINPEYSLEGLMLKLQYFGHLIRRADSLEKTLMLLEKTEGWRQTGRQRMRWLNGIINSMDMSLNKLWKVSEGQGSLECCSSWGHKELEKEMATYCSILAWKIPWTEEPDRLQSRGSQRVGHDWATSLSLSDWNHHHHHHPGSNPSCAMYKLCCDLAVTTVSHFLHWYNTKIRINIFTSYDYFETIHVPINSVCYLCVLVAQSYPTLCNPMDCSPPRSSSTEFSRQEH